MTKTVRAIGVVGIAALLAIGFSMLDQRHPQEGRKAAFIGLWKVFEAGMILHF